MKEEKYAGMLRRLESMKGEIYKGSELEKEIGFVLLAHGCEGKWSLADNADDCSREEENHDMINEFYIHVCSCDDFYADILCVINNAEDEVNDWVILVKDVLCNQ